jgi:hypothetical protein
MVIQAADSDDDSENQIPLLKGRQIHLSVCGTTMLHDFFT